MVSSGMLVVIGVESCIVILTWWSCMVMWCGQCGKW